MITVSGDNLRALAPRRAAQLLLLIASALLLTFVPSADATPSSLEPDRQPIVADSNVTAIEQVEGRVLVGGAFEHLGRRTGSAVSFSSQTGFQELGFPEVTGGGVEEAVPDGSGGWYLGGSFTHVGGQPHGGLAHVLPDYTVDPGFNASTNATVMSLALRGNTLYVGGNFGSLNGNTRETAGAVNATTGDILSWDPKTNSTVWAIEATSSGVYVGGWSWSRVIKTDPVTGANLGWGGNENSWVEDLLAANGKLYVATENGVDAFSESTGELLWSAPGIYIRSISLSGSTLYVGGWLKESAQRSDLAAVDAETGGLLPWAPQVLGKVNTVLATPYGVFAGGFFDTVNGDTRVGVVQLDPKSGATLGWSPRITGTVWSLAATKKSLLVAGGVMSIDSSEHRYLAALDPKSGWPLNWDPKLDSGVETITRFGNTIYIGGYFTSVAGQSRGHGAAFDARTGKLLPWDPKFDQPIGQLVAGANHVYVGGELAELDAVTGERTGWRPTAIPDNVYAIALHGDSLFVGGTGIHPLAGFDINDHHQYDWHPSIDSDVRALAIDGKSLYVGGFFSRVDGSSRPLLAEFSPTTLGLRETTLSRPESDFDGVWDLAVDADDLYVGGRETIGGRTLDLFSVKRKTGLISDWRPRLNGFILTMSSNDQALWVGGNMGGIGSVPSSGLARFPESPAPADPYLPTDPPGPGLGRTAVKPAQPKAPDQSEKSLPTVPAAKLRVVHASVTGKALRLTIRADRAASVAINVRNRRGRRVARFSRALVAGLQTLKLDLMDAGRTRFAAGEYSVSVSAGKGSTARGAFSVRGRGHQT